MKRPRLTLATLMLAIALVGIAFAGIRSGSRVWTQMLFALTVAIFEMAVVAARLTRGRTSAFWTGFAALQAVYVALVLVIANPSVQNALGTHEAFERLSAAIEESSARQDVYPRPVSQSWPNLPAYPPIERQWQRTQMMHTLCSLVWGLIGGGLGLVVFRVLGVRRSAAA